LQETLVKMLTAEMAQADHMEVVSVVVVVVVVEPYEAQKHPHVKNRVDPD
jgi:hypothetical protein